MGLRQIPGPANASVSRNPGDECHAPSGKGTLNATESYRGSMIARNDAHADPPCAPSRSQRGKLAVREVSYAQRKRGGGGKRTGKMEGESFKFSINQEKGEYQIEEKEYQCPPHSLLRIRFATMSSVASGCIRTCRESWNVECVSPFSSTGTIVCPKRKKESFP